MIFRSTCALLLSMLLLSPEAKAKDEGAWHVVLHTHSWHSSQPVGRRWNEDNWGLGIRRDFSQQWSWQVGAYRDSLKETSAYVLADWMSWAFDALTVGAGFGVITGGGYEEKYTPAAALVLRYSVERCSATVRFFPKPPPGYNPNIHRTAVTALEFSWRL